MSRSIDALVAEVTRGYTPPATVEAASPAERRQYEHLARRNGTTPAQVLGELRAAHSRQVVELDDHDALSAIARNARRN